MSKVVGDVAIKVGADTTSVVTGMRKAEASLNKFAVGAGVSLAGVATAMVAMTKASMANIDVLAKQARALGLSTQAFQKMAMVAGEAGVEAGALSNMLGRMQKNLDDLSQGTQAQVDTFQRLGLSMQELQGLSPDEQFAKIAESLDSIKDPAAKAALSMDVFGKAGRAGINMLSDYGAKANEAAEFQNRFGIAVSQVASDNIESANDAVGRLGMVMEGLGNRMATIVAPAVLATANAIISFAAAVVGAKVTLEEFFGTLENARDVLGEEVFNEILGRPDLIRENAAALTLLADATRGLAADAGYAVGEMRAFADQLDKLGQIGPAEVMRKFADELDRAKQEFASGAITGEQFRAKVKEIEERASDLVTELARVDGVSFGGVMGELGKLYTQLADTAAMARDLAAAMPGAESAAFIGPMQPQWEPDANAPKTRPQRQGIDSLGDWEHANAPKGGGGKKGGGGGGIKDQFAQRLEAIVEGLKTEAEVIAEWYATSLEALNQASDAELAAIGGKQEAIERLEKEHQERLKGIREMGNQWSVQAALDGGAEILGAMGAMNKKAAKLQGIFAAGSALMSTYQGAALELKKGTFGFAAAAAVIAKGIGFVAAIKSASSSAQSGGMASAGAASSANTPAPMSPANANITYYGTPTSSGMQTITERLNEEYKQGYRVNWDFQPY